MPIIKLILQLLGGVFLLLLLIVFGVAAVVMFPSSSTAADPQDVEFVLNQGGIDNTQDYSVIYSFESSPTLNGDRIIYHCIQLTSFSIRHAEEAGWKAGPEGDPIFAQLVEGAASIGNSDKCFSEAAKPNTSNVLAYVWSVHLLGRSRIEGAEVMLYDPSTMRLLYTDYET